MMLARERVDQHSAAIPSGEVTFHAHSFADDAGRLFWWGAQLCRGINSGHASFFARLFGDGVIQDLIERGLLIESELTELTFDDYPMVVKHRVVPFISYPNEWCAAMLKDAARTIVDLTIELARRGLTLKDAHPWNLLFDACRPVYVDMTSITPQGDEPGWPAYDEFCRFCYYPLILMAHGHERIARTLLPEYEGILRSDLLTMLRGSAPSRFVFSKLLRRGLKLTGAFFKKEAGGTASTLAFLKKVRRDLEQIQLPSHHSGQRDDERMIAPAHDWTPAQRSLGELLNELRPGTVLDLSRGAAWTSVLPAARGYNVVSVSADSARATSIYEAARHNRLPILPLVMDFIKPSPSVGYSSHYAIAATERLQCDMVIGLGLAHRLASENHFNFDLIAEGLSAFSKRWLVVDFAESCPPDDFISALRRRFNSVITLPQAAEQGAWLLCEKEP
jgi:hypothetical protein